MRIYVKSRLEIKEAALFIILIIQALALSLIDLWIPNFTGIPGVKLSLANIITVAALLYFKFSDTLLIILIRCVFSSLFVGGPTVFIFSICGAVLSAAVMWFMLKTMQHWFSVAGISVAGAVANNLGQLLAAYLAMRGLSFINHLPGMLLEGIVIGYLMGLCSMYLVKILRKLNMIPNL